MPVFHSARAWFRNRRRRPLTGAALAVFLLAGQVFAASGPETRAIDAAPRAGAAHEVTLTQTKPGREGLELSARLADGGGLITLPVAWTVRDAGGEKVLDEETPYAAALLPPGDYEVAIRYGTADYSQTISIPEAVRLGVTFTLDIGGIRVLPRIAGSAPAARAETRVYALNGKAAGRLVATSTLPGEILRVRAGAYRIESSFVPGNVVTAADVVVTAGLLKAVEIDHRAGLARLAPPAPGAVTWTITKAGGATLPAVEAPATEIALTPGDYTATAAAGGVTYAAAFSIAPGEIKTIAPRE